MQKFVGENEMTSPCREALANAIKATAADKTPSKKKTHAQAIGRGQLKDIHQTIATAIKANEAALEAEKEAEKA